MSRGPEALLHHRLKKNLSNSLIVRLENRVNLGLPDCLIALPPAKYCLVELKVVTTGKKVRLSAHQVAFALSHGKMGLPTYILVEWHPKGTTKLAEKRLLLYHGAQAQELFQDGVSTPPVAQWPLNSVDWASLRDILSKSNV